MQPGHRSLLDHPPQFYIPSNVAGFDFDETLRHTKNASNQNVLAVITEETRHSQPPIESGAGQGPAVKAAYRRFNGTEQKEREATAENWIQAEVRKRVYSNRKALLTNPKVVKPSTFLYEYAMNTKDNSFIKFIISAVAGRMVKQPDFACCPRGTTAGGTPTIEADFSFHAVLVDPMLNAQVGIKMILKGHLQANAVNTEMIEEVIECTFSEQNGFFLNFIQDVESRILMSIEDLPAYEWDEKSKMNIIKRTPNFKGATCQRQEHLECLYNHLTTDDKFFWRAHRTITTIAKERLREMNEEVVDTQQILQRLRRLEGRQDHILVGQGEINKSLDLHEKELVNIACNTFMDKQNEADKELVLKNMAFVKTDTVQQCRAKANDWLAKNGIRFHTGMFNIDANRKSCRLAFNSERDKKSAEGILAGLRRDSKSKSTVTSLRPDAKTFVGDVRKGYKEIKKLLHTYWQQYCTKEGFEHLIVPEDVWSKHIYIIQKVTGKGADFKLFYEFTDPSNMESFLVLNPEQNPFEVLELGTEVPNKRYQAIAGARAKTLNADGIHKMKK